jgi:beta-phosphoglucomutase-like phosphatase (HAD superfamily)
VDAQDDVRGLSGEELTVETIAAVLFEPVGCLAEFGAEAFDSAASELFGASAEAGATGSEAYWRLCGLLDERRDALGPAGEARLLELELRAVDHAELYEDVRPSLEELRHLGVTAYLVSSLSRPAVARFVERFSLADLFAASIARDDAGGVMDRPVRHAIASFSLDPSRTICLVDTAQALDMTKALGLNAVMMFNDFDKSRVLAERGPAGGVASLAELADALRLIEQRAGMKSPSRPPLHPYELFDPS